MPPNGPRGKTSRRGTTPSSGSSRKAPASNNEAPAKREKHPQMKEKKMKTDKIHPQMTQVEEEKERAPITRSDLRRRSAAPGAIRVGEGHRALPRAAAVGRPYETQTIAARRRSRDIARPSRKLGITLTLP